MKAEDSALQSLDKYYPSELKEAWDNLSSSQLRMEQEFDAAEKLLQIPISMKLCEITHVKL